MRSVLSVASHVFKQNECHHDPTPKPQKHPKTWKPQKPANLKTKCPVCGMPGVQVKRMPSRPHPETQNPQTLKASVLSVACHVFKQNECHHDPTPKPPKPETQNPPNLKSKCPVCGMPCVQAKRMPPRPHPETPKTPKPPKPETQNSKSSI